MAVAEERRLSAGGSVLLLTGMGAVSHVLGFFYRVALSRMVGAEVMGLYQLVMPVFSVVLSCTAVGLTAAVSNLTARRLALEDRRGADQVLRTCLCWMLGLLLPVGAALIWWSDGVSVWLLGDARTQLGLILLVPCAAFTGVENLHKHAFYGAATHTQRMLPQVRLAEPLPPAAVATLGGRRSVWVQGLMLCTIQTVCQIGTAGVLTWFQCLPRHKVHLRIQRKPMWNTTGLSVSFL